MVENCVNSTFINIFNYEKHSCELAHILPLLSPRISCDRGGHGTLLLRCQEFLYSCGTLPPVYITLYTLGRGRRRVRE